MTMMTRTRREIRDGLLVLMTAAALVLGFLLGSAAMSPRAHAQGLPLKPSPLALAPSCMDPASAAVLTAWFMSGGVLAGPAQNAIWAGQLPTADAWCHTTRISIIGGAAPPPPMVALLPLHAVMIKGDTSTCGAWKALISGQTQLLGCRKAGIE